MVGRHTILFAGRVQGVGFRYTVDRLARGRPLTGRVRNLVDGRVEMIVEGEPDAVADLLSAVRERFDGYLADVASVISPATGEFAGFSITR